MAKKNKTNKESKYDKASKDANTNRNNLTTNSYSDASLGEQPLGSLMTSEYSSSKKGSHNGGKSMSSKRIKNSDYRETTNPVDRKATASDLQFVQPLGIKELKNNVIELTVDEGSLPSSSGNYYPITAPFNEGLDAKYAAGQNNILGGSITAIQNDDIMSTLLDSVDAVQMVKRMNYAYISTDGRTPPAKTAYRNTAALAEYVKSVEEVISKAVGSSFTDLTALKNDYSSNIPLPTGLGNTIAMGITQGLYHYQSVLQCVVSPIVKLRLLLQSEAVLNTMEWRRGSPVVQGLFAYLRKSTFTSTFKQLGSTVLAEYFDDSWHTQSARVYATASAKALSMTDSMATIITTTKIPTLVITTQTDPAITIYDSAEVLKATLILADPITFERPSTGTTYSLEQLIYYINTMLDPVTILRFARRTTDSTTQENARGYSNNLTIAMEALNRVFLNFTMRMTALRQVLEVLNRTKTVYWKIGYDVYAEAQRTRAASRGMYDKLVTDLYVNTFAGSDINIFNEATQRWKTFTIWNKQMGIPRFDKNSSGSFITSSIRKLTWEDDLVSSNYEESRFLVPMLFAEPLTLPSSWTPTNAALAVTRRGIEWKLVSNASNLLNSHVLARLNPLSNTKLLAKVPVLTTPLSGLPAGVSEFNVVAQATRFLQDLCGYGVISLTDEEPITVTTIDNHLMFFIDVENYATTVDVINYMRSYAPFRVNLTDTSLKIGFGV